MKFVTVRDLRTTPAQVWKMLAEEQELVLTNNGKPIGLISSLDESNFEQTLTTVRRAKVQLAIQEAQRSAAYNNIHLTSEEIDTEIQASRQQKELPA